MGAGGKWGPQGCQDNSSQTDALLGERNLGYLEGVSITESQSHWDLHGKPSMARTAGHVSLTGGSWMDPPSSISILVVQRSCGNSFQEKPIQGKEAFVRNILNVTSACQEGMPEIN